MRDNSDAGDFFARSADVRVAPLRQALRSHDTHDITSALVSVLDAFDSYQRRSRALPVEPLGITSSKPA